jgi:hypothetical protein
MKKLNCCLLILAAVLCAGSTLAQGKMEAAWHSSNGGPPGTSLFEASFQIYDWQMAPGSMFYGSPLFQQTVSVTSPDHTWLPGTGVDRGSRVLTDGSLYLDVAFSDASFSGTTVFLSAGGVAEIGPSGPVYSEPGYFALSEVPEPSCAWLLIVGLLAAFSKKATSRK